MNTDNGELWIEYALFNDLTHKEGGLAQVGHEGPHEGLPVPGRGPQQRGHRVQRGVRRGQAGEALVRQHRREQSEVAWDIETR